MAKNLFSLPVAEVRSVEDLATLAKRLRAREKKSQKDMLDHAKKQASDILAARQQAKRGQWGPWCDEAGLSQERALQYIRFGKTVVTTDFSNLPEDQQWAEWQRISANATPGENDDDTDLAADLPAEPATVTTLLTQEREAVAARDYQAGVAGSSRVLVQ